LVVVVDFEELEDLASLGGLVDLGGVEETDDLGDLAEADGLEELEGLGELKVPEWLEEVAAATGNIDVGFGVELEDRRWILSTDTSA
jgi:hypothetical protein